MQLKFRVIISLTFMIAMSFAIPSLAERVCVRTDKGQTVCGQRVDNNNPPSRLGHITLFTYGGSAGRQVTLSNDKPDLSQLGLNNKVSSITVQSGIWQVCTAVSYKGYCVRLRPGYYGNLGALGINNSISSVRLIH
jgi:hypothetical protein